MPKKERGLGRGLDALLSNDIGDNSIEVMDIDIIDIVPNQNQPRRVFDDEKMGELSASIKEHGILQPILVKPRGNKYEIVAGERRWRAAQKAGLESVQAVVKDISDKEAAEISLIENLQRDDLNAIEEAKAYKNMIEKYEYTQETLSEKIGRSRSHIANMIRILHLPEEILVLLEEKKLSAGHARALLSISDKQEQVKLAKAIIEGNLSVRQVEEKVQKNKKEKPAGNKKKIKAPEILDLEDRMQRQLGTKAEINTGKKGGKIVIEYYNQEDLNRILEIFGL